MMPTHPTGHRPLPLHVLAIASLGLAGQALAQDHASAESPSDPGGADGAGRLSWVEAEAATLVNHVQLTTADRFYKAGESYFSPDDSRIIFQAIPAPQDGAEPDEIYAMFVADVDRGPDGRITGLGKVHRISPPGSANTCGWWDPNRPNVVLFATTVGPPSPGSPPGYNRKTGRYRWMFPPEMRIVRLDLAHPVRAEELPVIAGDGHAYHAEDALSPDGRFLVYCSLESGQGDLYVMDMATRTTRRVVSAPGYDGGPFFSPDGKRICYRSDRRGDNLLQLFVADLAFDDDGSVVGIEREHQLTDNQHVNWAPFWHPDGRHLVYATSEMGHANYEIFIIDADPGTQPGSTGSVRYGAGKRRVTAAPRADVLPAFSHDGKTMIWTSQRGRDGRSQIWAADFVMPLDPAPTKPPIGSRDSR